MHSLMELPFFSSLHLASRASLSPNPSKCEFYDHRFGRLRLNYGNSKSCFRISMSTDRDFSSDDYRNFKGDGRAEPHFVDVIAIGSRKDAMLDFCLDSPFRSSLLLRFWNMVAKDSENVQLQQRLLGKDLAPRSIHASLFLRSPPKTVILVASPGYGSDDIPAIDILKAVRSANGFVVAIVLKPFSFEGQRREDEVKVLIGNLQEHANFCIDIATDMLIQKDFVTLDEALKTANNAVLLAINAISVLASEMHKKNFHRVHDDKKELTSMEVIGILERYKEAKIGFGAGNNMKASILQAWYECPFIGVGVKDVSDIIICIVASSSLCDNSDMQAFAHTFRQTAEYGREIVICGVHEPNLEPGLVISTFITLGCVEQQASRERGILFRLSQYFPFVFNLLRRHHPESNETEENNLFENSRIPNVINLTESGPMGGQIALENVATEFDKYSEGPKTLISSNYDDSCRLRDDNSGSYQGEAGTKSSSFDDQVSFGTPAIQRETLNCWNLGPGHQIAQEWAKERAANSSAAAVHDNLSPFCVPVGVRPNGLKNGLTTELLEARSEDVVEEDSREISNMSPLGAMTEAGFEAMRDFCSSASILVKGSHNSVPEKQGILSIRAASMLEAERESPKKWNPVVEIQYRGGLYKGRCQGGLPEGKGRLVLGDGSIYDGMWCYGKRSGPGTFYFSNGDVFQGSWRDDVMHGKGWFYFHSGDRWFANFWKGKANGDGRFYSKCGNVGFGQFQNGWRHGQFLCINVDGARTLEIWDDGVLVGQEQMDLTGA